MNSNIDPGMVKSYQHSCRLFSLVRSDVQETSEQIHSVEGIDSILKVPDGEKVPFFNSVSPSRERQ